MPSDQEESLGVISETEVAAPNEIEDQQTEQELPESNEAVQEEIVVQADPPKKSKEDNLRQLGKAYEDLKRQNAELQNALVRFAPPPPPEPADELAGLEEDDFTNVSQVKKLIAREVDRQVASKLKEGRVERLEENFKGKHDDYDEVVNQDNFEKLFQNVPELRPVLAKAYELAVKGEDIDPVSLSYKLLKQFRNEGEEDMSTTNKKAPVEQKLVRNQNKPLSANAIKSSALTEAHKYMGGNPSKEDKARIYKETVEFSKARR